MTDHLQKVGFVGLGVMGGAMCANVLRKSGLPVLVYDVDTARVDILVELGAARAADLAEVARDSDVIFCSLPAAPHVEAVILGPDGLLAHGRPGQVVVDMSTSPVELAHRLGAELAAVGMTFVDAPVARARQAAIDGTLSIMVGSENLEIFEELLPLLSCMGTEVMHCGPIGAGALVKLLNNMVVFETVVALAEATAIARRSGVVDPAFALEVLGKGSAASFALENHGKKALAPDEHPTAAFSSSYMAKDLGYVIEYARTLGLELPGAELGAELLRRNIAAGRGDNYHTSVIRIIEEGSL